MQTAPSVSRKVSRPRADALRNRERIVTAAREMFVEFGPEVPFDDICPDIPAAARCEEMQAWLRQNPEVTRYVVLDDDDDCLDELPLFQPSSKTGLTDEIADGIEEFLAGRSDKDMRASAIARLGQNIHALFGRDKS